MQRTILLALLVVSSTTVNAEAVALKKEGGTFVVPVLVNDKITLDFIIDSGAADVSIPEDVFSTLVRAGTIAKSDFLGTQVYKLADGTEGPSQRFRIRSLRVGNLELRDVIGSVAPPTAALLLGQSFLARLQSWSFDNQRQMLFLNEPPTSVARIGPPPSNETSPVHQQKFKQTSARPGEGFPLAADYYPPAARRLAEEGSVSVRACVGMDGKLTEEPKVVRSSGSDSLNAGALQLAKAGSGHYKPATENGLPVPSCFVFVVTFQRLARSPRDDK